MRPAHWLIVIGFAIALAAGVVLGVAQDRARRSTESGSWLAAQLNLTAEQQEQVRQIWAEAMAGPEHRARGEEHVVLAQPADEPPGPVRIRLRVFDQSREALLRERDERVRELLTEDQLSRYDTILAEYGRRLDELKEARSRAVHEAIERTKAVLTEPQRARYEEILHEREQKLGLLSPHGPRGGGDQRAPQPQEGK